MNLYEAIFVRKSIRNYEMEPISPQLLKEICDYHKEIEGLNAGIQTEITVIDNTKKHQISSGVTKTQISPKVKSILVSSFSVSSIVSLLIL